MSIPSQASVISSTDRMITFWRVFFTMLPDMARKLLSTIYDIFALMMETSKGRDKLFALTQYTAELRLTAMISSMDDWMTVLNSPQSTNIIQRTGSTFLVREWFSGIRKVARFSKLFEEINAIRKICTRPHAIGHSSLSISSHLNSIIYYILDHLLLLSTLGLPLNLSTYSLRKYRNMFSLFRIFTSLMIAIYTITSRNMKQALLENLLSRQEKPIVENGDNHLYLQQLLNIRAKLRFNYLKLFVNGLRIAMLGRALNIFGGKRIPPVFVALCGIATASCSVLKMYFKPKMVSKLDEELIQCLELKRDYVPARCRQNNGGKFGFVQMRNTLVSKSATVAARRKSYQITKEEAEELANAGHFEEIDLTCLYRAVEETKEKEMSKRALQDMTHTNYVRPRLLSNIDEHHEEII